MSSNNESEAGQGVATLRICDVEVAVVDWEAVISWARKQLSASRCRFLVTTNVDHLWKLRKDVAFREAYEKAGLVVADGMPIVWMSGFLGTRLPCRIAGSDLAPALCEVASEEGKRVFLLGGEPGSAEGAASTLRAAYPALAVAGVYCPEFGFEKDAAENRAIIDKIRSAKADLLLVGLGAPKQEVWLRHNLEETGAALGVGVGVTFSFLSGKISRAPQWIQAAGFEWFWRLIQEPRRLWKRYLVEGPVVLLCMVREGLSDRMRRSER